MDNYQKKRIQSLDAYRGLACITVLLTHFWTEFSEKFGIGDVYAFWGIGKFGVAIFFLISAYFCMYNLSPNINLSHFFVKKILRIYIPFAVVAILSFVVDWVNSVDGLMSLLDFSKLTGHFWTLAVEIKFYFFFAILIVFAGGRKYTQIIILGILTLASAVSIVIFPPECNEGNAQGLQYYILIFSIGIAAAMLSQSNFIQKYLDKAWIKTLFDMAFLATACVVALNIPIIKYYVWDIPMDGSLIFKYLQLGVAAGIMFVALLCGRFFKLIFDKSILLKYIGTRSYSIYLIHYIVFQRISDYSLNCIMYSGLAIGITLVLSEISYRLLEKRATRYVISCWIR